MQLEERFYRLADRLPPGPRRYARGVEHPLDLAALGRAPAPRPAGRDPRPVAAAARRRPHLLAAASSACSGCRSCSPPTTRCRTTRSSPPCAPRRAQRARLRPDRHAHAPRRGGAARSASACPADRIARIPMGAFTGYRDVEPDAAAGPGRRAGRGLRRPASARTRASTLLLDAWPAVRARGARRGAARGRPAARRAGRGARAVARRRSRQRRGGRAALRHARPSSPAPCAAPPAACCRTGASTSRRCCSRALAVGCPVVVHRRRRLSARSWRRAAPASSCRRTTRPRWPAHSCACSATRRCAATLSAGRARRRASASTPGTSPRSGTRRVYAAAARRARRRRTVAFRAMPDARRPRRRRPPHVATVVDPLVETWEQGDAFPRDAAAATAADGLCGPVRAAEGRRAGPDLRAGDAGLRGARSRRRVATPSRSRCTTPSPPPSATSAARACADRWAQTDSRPARRWAGSPDRAARRLRRGRDHDPRRAGRRRLPRQRHARRGSRSWARPTCSSSPAAPAPSAARATCCWPAIPRDREGVSTERVYRKMASSFLPIGEMALDGRARGGRRGPRSRGRWLPRRARRDRRRADGHRRDRRRARGDGARHRTARTPATARRSAAACSTCRRIQFALADVATDIAAGRLLYVDAAAQLGTPEGSVAAAHAKRFCPDMALRAALRVQRGAGRLRLAARHAAAPPDRARRGCCSRSTARRRSRRS